MDSRASAAGAAEIETDLSELGGGGVRWLVNTHAHFDHTFGNQHFGPGSRLEVPIYGHHLLPTSTTTNARGWLRGVMVRVASRRANGSRW